MTVSLPPDVTRPSGRSHVLRGALHDPAGVGGELAHGLLAAFGGVVLLDRVANGSGHHGAEMIRQALGTLQVSTTGRGFHEITRQVQAHVADAGVRTGLCTLHLQHTSASLLIQENADPDVRRDFERFFARLVPDGDRLFVHTAEGDDDMPAHVRTALTAVNLSVPVAAGRLCLGTWQGIYVWEHRRAPHTRSVMVHVIGD